MIRTRPSNDSAYGSEPSSSVHGTALIMHGRYGKTLRSYYRPTVATDCGRSELPLEFGLRLKAKSGPGARGTLPSLGLIIEEICEARGLVKGGTPS